MRIGLSLMITLLASLGGTAALAQEVASHAEFVPSDELNKHLPRWLRLSGEFRTRLEGFTSGGFRAGNDDDYLLTRLRINMHIQPASWLKFEFQGQDARVFWKNQRPAAPPFQDTVDLRLAYIQIGDPEHKTFGRPSGENTPCPSLKGESRYGNGFCGSPEAPVLCGATQRSWPVLSPGRLYRTNLPSRDQSVAEPKLVPI